MWLRKHQALKRGLAQDPTSCSFSRPTLPLHHFLPILPIATEQAAMSDSPELLQKTVIGITFGNTNSSIAFTGPVSAMTGFGL